MPSASLTKIELDSNTFNFEDLPAEMRLRVYRELLVSPAEIDPVYGRDAKRLHPAILRVSNKIREEADAVLYGENIFASTIWRHRISKLWHRELSRKALMPRSSSRKIRQIHLYVNTTNNLGCKSEPPGLITVNAGLAATKLSLNNLKLLKVTYNHYQCLSRPHSMANDVQQTCYGYYDAPERVESCMEPLKLIRAAKVNSLGPLTEASNILTDYSS